MTHQDPDVLEVIIMVRGDKKPELETAVTLLRFASADAASQAVLAIVEWCSRWALAHGFLNELVPAANCGHTADKGTNTEETPKELKIPPATDQQCRWSLNGTNLKVKSAVGWCSEGAVGGGQPGAAAAAEGPWALPSDLRIEGGRGLLLHADSRDLSSSSSLRVPRKNTRKDSKIWRLIGRGITEDEDGEAEGNDGVKRWSRVSTARDSILMHREAKGGGSSTHTNPKWLSFNVPQWCKAEASKATLPRGRSGSTASTSSGQHGQHQPRSGRQSLYPKTRSHTPPKARNGPDGRKSRDHSHDDCGILVPGLCLEQGSNASSPRGALQGAGPGATDGGVTHDSCQDMSPKPTCMDSQAGTPCRGVAENTARERRRFLDIPHVGAVDGIGDDCSNCTSRSCEASAKALTLLEILDDFAGPVSTNASPRDAEPP